MDEDILKRANEEMARSYNHAEAMLKKLQAHKVDEDMLQGIMVDYYGVLSPIHQVATIKVDSMTTLRVKPWEKKLLPTIEHAIVQQNHVGFSTRHDGDEIFVSLPTITEEVRHKFIKQIEHKTEQSRVALRNIRKKNREQIKQMKGEDEIKRQENELQKLTDSYIERLNILQNKKKQELMRV